MKDELTERIINELGIPKLLDPQTRQRIDNLSEAVELLINQGPTNALKEVFVLQASALIIHVYAEATKHYSTHLRPLAGQTNPPGGTSSGIGKSG